MIDCYNNWYDQLIIFISDFKSRLKIIEIALLNVLELFRY